MPVYPLMGWEITNAAHTPHISNTSTIESQISIHFALQLFSSYSPFGNNCTEWPQMLSWTLWCQRYPVLSPQVTYLHLIHFTANRLRGTGHLVKVHWMTQKWPWIIEGQRYPTYDSLVPRVPNFTPFRCMISHFDDIDNFHLQVETMVNFIFFSKRNYKVLKSQ